MTHPFTLVDYGYLCTSLKSTLSALVALFRSHQGQPCSCVTGLRSLQITQITPLQPASDALMLAVLFIHTFLHTRLIKRLLPSGQQDTCRRSIKQILYQRVWKTSSDFKFQIASSCSPITHTAESCCFWSAGLAAVVVVVRRRFVNFWSFFLTLAFCWLVCTLTDWRVH